MSAAAASLYMSQPAMSHQIATLEKELGLPVVERLWRGVRVTVAGRAAAEEARIALRAAENAVQIGKRVGSGGAGRLRIACVETMTSWLLAPVLHQWRSCRPDVVLELSEWTCPDAMVEVLGAGGADVAVGPRPTRTQGHVEVIGQLEMVVVAPPGHRFSQMAAVPVQAFVDEMFVHYDPAHVMATWISKLAADHGVILKPVLRTGSPRTAAQLATAGMGVTIVPISALVPRPAGVIRRLHPMVNGDIIAMAATPLDVLAQRFIGDLHRCGVPNWPWPNRSHTDGCE